VWLRQVHGADVVTVVEAPTTPPAADAAVTTRIGMPLVVLVADCAPIALVAPGAVAVVHAGWRGSAVRAAGAAVEVLRERFGSAPQDVVAGIGPAIGPCCYTVGQDVVEAFADRPDLFTAVDSGQRLDLWEANRRALVEAGVPAEHIEVAGICTQCQSERFFSHRANGGQPAGRFAAGIRLDN